MRRGGVLCDQVGFGKTATTIGLIQEHRNIPLPARVTASVTGVLHDANTLIFVPGHLIHQWQQEVKKFLPKAEIKVLNCHNVAPLKKATVADIASADSVICTYRLLYSQIYNKRRDEIRS